jgi:hypothetical protein
VNGTHDVENAQNVKKNKSQNSKFKNAAAAVGHYCWC